MKKLLLISLILVSISSCYGAQWEEIREKPDQLMCNMKRLYVPHGWFVTPCGRDRIFFYQDEKHEWKI